MKKFLATGLFCVLILFAVSAAADLYSTEYGVKFGMTPQEVQDIETQNGNELKGTFEDYDSYQLYYETDVHLYSLRCVRMQYDFDVVDRLLYQVYYVSKGGAADFAYLNSLLSTKYGAPVNDTNDSGDYSLHYDRLGRDDGHIEAAHWLVPELNLGVDLWYNDYDSVFTTFYDTSNLASYGALPQYYTDEVTGISFAHMDGWDASLFALPPMKRRFTLRRDTETSVMYFQMDIWEELKDSYEPLGIKREDIGPDFLEDYIVAQLMHPIELQNLRTEQHGSLKYRVFEYQTDNNGASPELYYCTDAMTCRDGYIHIFQLSSVSKHDESMPAFETLLSSVTFGGIPVPSTTKEPNINSSGKTALIDLGSIVTLGLYEQDNNTANGKEPIQWIVIGIEDDSVNLISKDILDLQRYNIQKVDITWASCNLRNWLNNDFFNSAFTLDEQRAMKRWPYTDTDGSQLNDYVYCLSANEVETIWPEQQDRVALVTDYVFALPGYANPTKAGQWWLRSESVYNGLTRTAQDVYRSGSIGVDNFRNVSIGVRPCICVNITAVGVAESKQSVSASTDGGKYEKKYI